MNSIGRWYTLGAMVDSEIDDRRHVGRIILRPNASSSWHANLYLLYTLIALSTCIGIGFLWRGAWVILPYSMLEMAALSACLYYCMLRCRRQEVIIVSEHDVSIESGGRQPIQKTHFHRLWAQFLVKPPRHPWDPAVVSIRSHGQELEIGSFLSRRDKTVLIAELRRVVAGYALPDQAN